MGKIYAVMGHIEILTATRAATGKTFLHADGFPEELHFLEQFQLLKSIIELFEVGPALWFQCFFQIRDKGRTPS